MTSSQPSTSPVFGPDQMSSALGAALKSSGVSLADAAYYLKRAGMFGQVGFASGAKNIERLDMLKAARGALLASISQGAQAADMNNSILLSLIPHSPADLRKVNQAMALTTNAKRNAAARWAEDGFMLCHVCKLDDLGREEMIGMLSGVDQNSCAPMDSWDRVDHKARFLAGDPPAMVDGSSPPDQGTWCLEPQKIEEALSEKASSLMVRFGIGNIRISGFPSFERAQATLGSLEIALAQTAKAAGIPEKAMGLGGDFCIHVNADVGRASGYSSGSIDAICLSPDNGWRTLSHEWFHSFDGSLGSLFDAHPKRFKGYATAAIEALIDDGKLPQAAQGFAQMSSEDWKAQREAAFSSKGALGAQTTRLALSTAGMMNAIRHAPGTDSLADISREEIKKSTQRVVDGLYDRFYKNRVEPGLERQALQSFETMFESVLKGSSKLPEIAKWRQAFLGERAGLSGHYDAFVMAEKTARDSRVAARSENQSTMEQFAQIADKHLSAATGGNDWTGYSSSSVEMGARGFEGNCFSDTPDTLRHYMVDGRDNSMYWPVGPERGAHRDAFRSYLASGTMALIESGKLARSILDGFDPADPSPKPKNAFADIKGKLAAKRQATHPVDAPAYAKTKTGC